LDGKSNRLNTKAGKFGVCPEQIAAVEAALTHTISILIGVALELGKQRFFGHLLPYFQQRR
jgi:hypothetical protein